MSRRWRTLGLVGFLSQLARGAEGVELDALLKRNGLSLREWVQLNQSLLGLDPIALRGLGQGPLSVLVETHQEGRRKRRLAKSSAALLKALQRLAVYPLDEAPLAALALDLLATGSLKGGPALRGLAERLRAEVQRRGDPVLEGQPQQTFGRLPEGMIAPLLLAQRAAREGLELRFHYRSGERHKEPAMPKRRLLAAEVTLNNNKDYIVGGLDPERERQPRFYKLEKMFVLEAGPSYGGLSEAEQKNLRARGTNSDFQRSAPAVELWARGAAAEGFRQGVLRAEPLAKAKRPAWLKGTEWKPFQLKYHRPADLVEVLLPMLPDVTLAGPADFRKAWQEALERLRKSHK